jgi:nitrogen-specific signal transduction histidine kinase
LQIRNPYYGNIKIKNNVFYSTKHEGTGQGLYSAQLIAEKYNGIMNVNYENQTFEVRILLTLPTTFS